MKNGYIKSAVFAAVVASLSVAAPLSAAYAGADFSQTKIRSADEDDMYIVDYVLDSQKAGAKAPVSTAKPEVSKVALGTSSDDDSAFIVDYVVQNQKAGANAPISQGKPNLKLGVPADDNALIGNAG
ncbi:hypothetical protein [uncultured Cohaesibacter sp.]|uniref:hypothetical protein n=1 Tax=uncultured Cohaesibacter sp. TaxID=1002546 RepID=UPI0029C985F6|nr:hypothetical protein [uncultured Cohaesibacter sp.]